MGKKISISDFWIKLCDIRGIRASIEGAVTIGSHDIVVHKDEEGNLYVFNKHERQQLWDFYNGGKPFSFGKNTRALADVDGTDEAEIVQEEGDFQYTYDVY